MTAVVDQFRALRSRGLRQPLRRGTPPKVSWFPQPIEWIGVWVFFGAALLVFFPDMFTQAWISQHPSAEGIRLAAIHAGLTGLGAATLYYAWPIFFGLGWLVRHRQRPSHEVFKRFSKGQRLACLLLMALALFVPYHHRYLATVSAWYAHHGPLPWVIATHPFLLDAGYSAGMVALLAGVLAIILWGVLPREAPLPQRPFKRPSRRVLAPPPILPFGLWLGRSTGLLARRWHQAGLAPNLDLVLTLEEAAQNILVLGGIGAGKTTRLMQPLLVQLLEQSCGGLLFDVKGDVKHAVIQLGEMTNRQVTFLGPQHSPINLLAGLPPEIAASFLKSAFLLSGGVRLEGFWIESATELCRNTLGLLSFLPAHYTLQGLYRYLFDESARDAIQAELAPLLVTLAPREQRLLHSYLRYHDIIFQTFDEKVKSGINATVAQVLSPFTHPELVDAFCHPAQSRFPLSSVLEGTVYVVDMPLARWGLGAKVAYTFLKLRFFNVMQSRVHHPDWNQERPIFFMCDEYQELISANKDGLSDLNFWDKSRSSKTLGIVSAQSVSSFYAALGDRDLAQAILQNFRQKVCFRTEDQATLTLMEHLAGQANVPRQTTSRTRGHSRRGWLELMSQQHSNTQSLTESRESVLDAALFRRLTPNQAVALLSLQGHSSDDVVECLPVFL